MAIVAEVQQTGSGFDGEALASEIRRAVAAEHGASMAVVRLLRPRCVEGQIVLVALILLVVAAAAAGEFKRKLLLP